MKRLPVPFALLATLFAAFASSAATAAPAKVSDGALTNDAGRTLYTFERDTAGKSACNGQCATNWPPLLAQSTDKADGDYSVITRDDGRKQWAYKGKPLYLWSKDQKPGDKNGDGVNNVWHVAKP